MSFGALWTYCVIGVMMISFGLVLGNGEALSEEPVALFPPPLPPGLDARHVFAEWGVVISNEAGVGPVTGIVTAIPGYNLYIPSDEPVVLNQGAGQEDTGHLTFVFDNPLHWVRLMLAAESPTLAVTRFFDAEGTGLGEVERPLDGLYALGFSYPEVESPGIVRVEVEYAEPDVPEAVIVILAEFVEPPSFRRCVPQIVHGELGEDRMLQTLLMVSGSRRSNGGYSSSAQDQYVSLKFRNSEGAPLAVYLDGEMNSEFEYYLGYFKTNPRSLILRTTDSVSVLDQGYVCGTSNYPFEMGAVYRILDSEGTAILETGIDSVKTGHRFVGVFEKKLAQQTNTALAVANVSDQETTATITFLLSPKTTFEGGVVLGPGEHRAWFVDELSSELLDRDAEGSVEIVSDEPIVATIVRTIQGVVSASLPLKGQPAHSMQ